MRLYRLTCICERLADARRFPASGLSVLHAQHIGTSYWEIDSASLTSFRVHKFRTQSVPGTLYTFLRKFDVIRLVIPYKDRETFRQITPDHKYQLDGTEILLRAVQAS